MKAGDTFSREKIVDSVKRITDRLGNDGYSFANVNPVPDLDREKRVAGFTFFVDPGRRVYVRRVNVVGQPADPGRGHPPRAAPARELLVLAREDRALQGAPAAHRLLLRGEHRDAGRAGHRGPGRRERARSPSATPAASTSAWATPQAEKLTIQASISQANILGTGNLLAFQVNNGSVNKIYSLIVPEPVLDRRRRLARLRLLPPRRGHVQSLAVAELPAPTPPARACASASRSRSTTASASASPRAHDAHARPADRARRATSTS